MCNILSLDIVLGSVISALFFARLFAVAILPYGLASLALTVWIIYTADHLLDARAISKVAASERHRFHQKHFHLLKIIVAIAVLLDVVLIFFMRKPVFVSGIFLAAFVFVYLLAQRYLRVLKEFFVAFFYTCGVLLPSLSVTSVELNFGYGLVIFQFLVIAWTNLLLFSWFDYDEDRTDLQDSFVTIAGKRFAYYFIGAVGIFNLCLSWWLWKIDFNLQVIVILAFMQLILLVILLLHRPMKRGNVYRLLGDAVFALPLVYIL